MLFLANWWTDILAWFFFSGLKFHNYLICVQSTGMINHVFRSFFAVQIYSLTFFTIYGYITNSLRGQLTVGLIAQVVEHCAGIAEVSNPVVCRTEMINHSGAPAARRAAKRSPIPIKECKGNPRIDFLMVIMASGITLFSWLFLLDIKIQWLLAFNWGTLI